MAIDLTLLPFDADGPTVHFSHTLLPCLARRDLFEDLMQAPGATPLPEDFSSYLGEHAEPCGESGYGLTRRDPYGKAILSLPVAALLPFATHKDVQDNYKNRAIWAYLKELPPETKVALYWN